MADTMDSKSIVRKGVRVQIPPPARATEFADPKDPAPILFGPMNIEQAFAQIGDRLAKAREELHILEEQIFFQIDVLEEAKTRMVVSETPLGEREYRIARDDHARLEAERAKVLETIEELKREQDRLLDVMASRA